MTPKRRERPRRKPSGSIEEQTEKDRTYGTVGEIAKRNGIPWRELHNGLRSGRILGKKVGYMWLTTDEAVSIFLNGGPPAQ